MKGNKKGITLIVLVITIVVGLILVVAGVAAVSSAITDATKASFAEELKLIEDEVNLYYLQNNDYPGVEDSDNQNNFITYSPKNISGIMNEDKFNKLRTEMKENKENGDEDITSETETLAFYVIDLDKLNLDRKARGTKYSEENNEDVYVVSAKTNKVYYLKGVKAGGETYFSLSSKLINYVNKSVTPNNEGNVEVTQAGSLTVKRLKKTWTNTLGITLSISETSSTISVALKNGDSEIAKIQDISISQNEYIINSLDDLPGANFTNVQKSEFNNSLNKKIEFTKGSDTLVVDVSNYDVNAPIVNIDEVSKSISENENVLTFKVKDEQSGIKEVKYGYLKEYDENGEPQNYYEGTDILNPLLDSSFIKARGKKAEVSEVDEDGYVTVRIKIPFSIEGIEVVIWDKAKNENLVVIGVYDFPNDPYIGCKLKTINSSGLTFKTIFNTGNENNKVTSYAVKVSTDGKNYAGDFSEDLSTPSDKYVKLVNAYKTGLEIVNNIYVKIIANIADEEHTRIFKFSIDEAEKLEKKGKYDNVLCRALVPYNQSYHFLSSTIKREEINKISFEKSTVVENADYTFDVSANGDGSIMGYAVYNNDTDGYDIIISSDETIYANGDSSYLFAKMFNLQTLVLDNFDTSNVTNMAAMFNDCNELTSLDVSKFDTSNVANMASMFENCYNLTSLDVSKFDTGNVTDMSDMFYGCIGVTSLDLSDFDTSNVTNMAAMFNSCNDLTNLDVSKFDTSNVTNMASMFENCYNLTSLDVSKFDTSNVTNMASMFQSCSGLTSLDVSDFDTGNVTDMSDMFYGCIGVTSLDLSDFDTGNVTNMTYMFCQCINLTTIYASNKFVTTAEVSSNDMMFSNCTALVGGNGTSYSSSHKDKTYARIDKAGSPGYFTAK